MAVKPCPTCGREVADAASVCDSCEAWAAALEEPRPAEDAVAASEASGHAFEAPDRASETVGDAANAAAPAPEPAPRASGLSRRHLTIAAAAVAAVALTGFVMLGRGGSAPAAAVAAAAPAARVTPPSAKAAPAATAASAAVQTWNTANQEAWVDDRRRGAAFELLAENTVKTWFGPSRPSLVVRCAARQIEAFVVVGSPMKIDPRVEGKRVTISLDGEPVRTELWTDSDARTAVFAPDSAGFTQRLRTARTLSFGYSPHNSSDVVAQFHVAGLEALMAASKHCGPAK